MRIVELKALVKMPLGIESYICYDGNFSPLCPIPSCFFPKQSGMVHIVGDDAGESHHV